MYEQQVARHHAIQNLKPDMNAVLDHNIFDAKNKAIRFGDALAVVDNDLSRDSTLSSTPPDSPVAQSKVLVIFIRHFFCGICQDYLRSLAASPSFSTTSLHQRNVRVIIVGCGAASLIESYRISTDLPQRWHLYADPSTDLYRILGMQKTYSMGPRNPRYLRRSLTGNMLRSIGQSMKRVPEGDVLAAGAWDVQGGEFIFEQQEEWQLTWGHRMLNSRDHTEIDEIAQVLGLEVTQAPAAAENGQIVTKPQPSRTMSTPIMLENDSLLDEKIDAATPIKRRSTLRRTISIRRQSWMNAATSLSRSMSVRVP